MADSRPLISTFVFTKIHTTGRNWENQPACITEISMRAILRDDIGTDALQPEELEFTTLVQPPEPPSSEAANATALNFDDLVTAPFLEDIIDQLNDYLNNLPKPICLVAQNGKSFDFRILRQETRMIGKELPEDLLMADFKHIFNDLLKQEFQGTGTKIGQSIEAICEKLDVELKGKVLARSWVIAMIGCVMKRKGEFLMRVDGKYSTPFYKDAEF